jgi:SPP1 family predicted phage head-tail adaptor
MSWMRPTVGDLSEPVTLFSPAVPMDDGQGGQIPGTPVQVATIYAQVDPRSGQEVLAGNGLIATTPFRFRILYRTDVTSDWLLEWRGRTLQITADPQPEGFSLRQWLVISAMGGPA